MSTHSTENSVAQDIKYDDDPLRFMNEGGEISVGKEPKPDISHDNTQNIESLDHIFSSTSLSTKGVYPLYQNLPSDGQPETTVNSIISRAFSPRVGVLSSPDVDQISQLRGVESFYEILRPFGDLVKGNVTVRNSNGSSSKYDDFCVHFYPVQITHNQDHMQWLQQNISANTVINPVKTSTSTNDMGNEHILSTLERLVAMKLDSGCPSQVRYFHYFRKLVSDFPISPHETFAHPAAIIIAVSTKSPNVLETFMQLHNSLLQTIPNRPSYMDSNFLRYYVLVNDNAYISDQEANGLFEQLKRSFGLHSYLLNLNDRTKAMAENRLVSVSASEWISSYEEMKILKSGDSDILLPREDCENLENLVQEMVKKSLVSFMEHCIHSWSHQVLASRKGLSGRLAAGYKRFLNTANRNQTNGSSARYNSSMGAYATGSSENEMRRLGDFAFMLRDYYLSHEVFDIIRRDYMNDKAWKHYAGAQEMILLSRLMIPEKKTAVTHNINISNKSAYDWVDTALDSASYTYLARCSSPYLALRSLLCSIELLASKSGDLQDLSTNWVNRTLDMGIVGGVGYAILGERFADLLLAHRDAIGGVSSRKRKGAFRSYLTGDSWIKIAQPKIALDRVNIANSIYEKSDWPALHKEINDVREIIQKRINSVPQSPENNISVI